MYLPTDVVSRVCRNRTKIFSNWWKCQHVLREQWTMMNMRTAFFFVLHYINIIIIIHFLSTLLFYQCKYTYNKAHIKQKRQQKALIVLLIRTIIVWVLIIYYGSNKFSFYFLVGLAWRIRWMYFRYYVIEFVEAMLRLHKFWILSIYLV